MKKFNIKPIIVLLSIALICSGLLAILNNVLFVSAEERTSRAIKKIYGEEKEYEIITEEQIEYTYGTINVVYKIENADSSYDLLIKSTGNEGYKNGTITLWVQVNIDNETAKIEKTILEGYEKQTLMSKLTGSYYNSFEFLKDDFYSTDNSGRKNVVSGATKSSNACCNAINCVIEYVQGVINNAE
ncbi:MAG: FMN-binding protein [Firmicutes bacterium]|nr:FMN-binding protein [Candidatus Caballimonas caccae]